MSLFDRIDTVCLAVSDIEKAKKWYGDNLKLKVILQEANYAMLSTGDSSIPLTIEEGKVTPNNSTYPIFNTTNIVEVHKDLSEKGVKTTEIVKEESIPFLDVFDPDGNRKQVCFA